MRGVAKAFGMPKSTLARHIKEHVKQQPEKVTTARSRAAGALAAIADATAGPTRHEVGQTAVKALAAAPPSPRPEVEADPPLDCPVCASPKHYAIGVAVRQGATYATIAARHALDVEDLRRHALGCIPDLLAQAGDLAARTSPSFVVQGSGGTMCLVENLWQKVQHALDDTAAEDDLGTRAKMFTAAKGVLETLAKMRGDLTADTELRLVDSPAWGKVKGKLSAALVPYPEALAAVATALDGVE